MTEITHCATSLPKNLVSVEQAAEKLQTLGLTEAELVQLADTDYAPHWRVNGGRPLFQMSELKSWLEENLAAHHDGRPLPRSFRVQFEPAPIIKGNDLPPCLRGVASLCDITGMVNLCSGIYFLCKDGEVVYVGQSISPLNRVRQHFSDKDRTVFRACSNTLSQEAISIANLTAAFSTRARCRG